MKLSCVVITSVCLCASDSTLAAEWSAQPIFSSSVDHDTNRGLGAEEQGSQGAFLQADVILRRATAASNLWIRPHAGWQAYTNSGAQDQRSLSLSGAGTWMLDRNQLSAQASISRDNTLNNEANDTGALTGTTERNAKSASLGWSREQSPRRRLDLRLGYSDIRYENQRFIDFFGLQIPFVNLYGYQYPSVNATESIQWTDRTSLQITGYANRLISRSNLGDSDSYGVRLGVTRALTEHYALTLAAGSSLQANDDGNESGYIGRFGLDYTGDLSRWSLYAERSVSPSAFGYLVTRNEAGMSFDRRLSPRFSVRASARNFWNEGEIEQSGERHRYGRAELSASWAGGRTWQLGSSVAYTSAQFTSDSPLAESWRVMLNASWTPVPRRLSR